MKWIFWDLPRVIIRTVRKQNVRHESGEQEITPILRDSRAVGSRNNVLQLSGHRVRKYWLPIFCERCRMRR